VKKTLIALDVGRSAVKAIAESASGIVETVFPSITMPATNIADEGTAARAKLETVVVDGKAYFTGDMARLQGNAAQAAGLSKDWMETHEYRALVQSAVDRLGRLGAVNLRDAYIVVGTPAAQYAKQAARLEEITRRTLGGQVKALSQPMGAYLSYLLNPDGYPIDARRLKKAGGIKSYAVIEVGYYSTDFLLMKEGMYIESKSDSCKGLYIVAEQLVRILAEQDMHVSQLDCEQAIQTGWIQYFGEKDVSQYIKQAAEFMVNQIVTKADTLFAGEIAKLDGVLLAGGGASIIHARLAAKWPNTVLLDNPRMAVAQGFLRYARGIDLKRRLAEEQAKHLDAAAKQVAHA